MADVEVKNEGSVVLLIPMSDRGKDWIDENLQLESWQWYGNAAAVEARYADPIVDGMMDDGLEVKGTTRVIPEESDLTPEQEEDMVRRGQLPPMEMRSSRTAALPAQQRPPEGTPAADMREDPWAAASQAISQPDDQAARRRLRHTVEPEIPGGPYHMVSSGRGFRSAFLRQPRWDGYCDACDRPEAQCVCSPEDCDLTRERA